MYGTYYGYCCNQNIYGGYALSCTGNVAVEPLMLPMESEEDAPGAPVQVACACTMPDGTPMTDHTSCPTTGTAGGFGKCCEAAALPIIMNKCVGVAEDTVSAAAYAKVVAEMTLCKVQLKAAERKITKLKKKKNLG